MNNNGNKFFFNNEEETNNSVNNNINNSNVNTSINTTYNNHSTYDSAKSNDNNGSSIVSRENSFNRSTNPSYNNNHSYNQAANLMSRHFTDSREALDYTKTVPKSIIIFIICGLIAFFIGPKFILTYSTKYMSNSITNLFTNLPSGKIDVYALVMNSYIVGMLSFFYALFGYSLYNLIRGGYCLETFKQDTLNIFGCTILIAMVVCIADQSLNINLVESIIKILTLGGKTFKYII